MICRRNSSILIPISEMAQGTPPWLGQGFVQKALRKGEGDESIQVINIFTKPATNKGDNYTSNMIRATVDISREKGGRKITEKRSIVIKIAPDEEKSRDLVSCNNWMEHF